MVNFILSETKSSLGRKYTRVYIIGIFALVLIANIAVMAFRAIYGANEGTYAYNLMEYATWCFIIPYYSCIFIADIVVGKEYPNPLIRDGKTSGLSRIQLYLSRLVISVLIGAVFALIAVLALLLITTLFQIKDGFMGWYAVTDFFGKFLIAVPLWIAGLSFGLMFLSVFENKKKAYIFYFILTILIPRTIMIFAAEPFKIGVFRFLRKFTISQNMSLIPYLADPARNVPLTIALGIIYTVIAAVTGCIVYNRKKFN